MVVPSPAGGIAHINGMSTVEFQTQNRYARPRDVIDIFLAIALKPAD